MTCTCLRITPSTLIVKPGEEAKTTVTIEPVHEYFLKVELSVDNGNISPAKGSLPIKATWSLGVLEPGDYRFTITAQGTDGTTSSAIFAVTVESPEIEIEVEKLDLTHVGAKLLRITPKDMLSLKMALDTTYKLNLKAEAETDLIFAENIRFTGKMMDVKLAGLFVQKFSDVLRSLPSLEKAAKISSAVSLTEPTTLDASKITALTPLSEKVIFRLRVKRYD